MDESSHRIDVTVDNFEEEVVKFDGVVLVDFWATWCGPCRAMAPRIAALAEKYADNDKVKIVEIDVDAQPELSQKFQVLSIPTFKAFIGGEPVDQRIGLIPATELENLLQSGLSKLPA
ncbi:MAG: thioredoxin [bacterium]